MNSHLKNNLKTIKKQIDGAAKPNQNVTLIAASKTQPISKINEAINCQITNFGENKVQEAEKKFTQKTTPIKLHLIGHLQSNKTNKAVRLFDTIQTVDSLKIAKKINQSAKKINKKQNVFCQINIGNDPQKKGFSKSAFLQNIESLFALQNIQLSGLMTILPQNKNKKTAEQLYLKMQELKNTIEKTHNIKLELSMGMSGDYVTAIKQGSTMIRVGTALFGARVRQ